MTDQLTPGQSLTREQVRNLPDGAKVAFIWADTCDIFTAPITDGGETGILGILRMHLLSEPQYTSAVLVSLPSEPSPGEGYRWLVRDVDTIEPSDEYLNELTGVWEPSQPGFVRWLYTSKFAKMRRRIEPQADPATRVASDVAQRASLSHMRYTVDRLQRAISDKIADDVYDLCAEYREAYDHARSIGAI